MQPSQVPEISTMSIPEKILFLEALWDDIALQDSAIAMPESHQNELARRHQRYLETGGELLSLAELQERIEKKK